MICFLGVLICNNLSCTLFGANFLGAFLCNNVSYTLFGTHFWGDIFAKTTLAHFGAHFLCVFLCNKLSCTLFDSRFWVLFFVRTSLAHCLVLVSCPYFFQKTVLFTAHGTFFGLVNIQQPLLHTVWCTIFECISFSSYFEKASLAYFVARFLACSCTIILLYNACCTFFCAFLCVIFNCKLFGARFLVFFFFKQPLLFTTYRMFFCTCSFAATSLAHCLLHVFGAFL